MSTLIMKRRILLIKQTQKSPSSVHQSDQKKREIPGTIKDDLKNSSTGENTAAADGLVVVMIMMMMVVGCKAERRSK